MLDRRKVAAPVAFISKGGAPRPSDKHMSSMHSVTPYLLYEDVTSSVGWLSCAFGFQEVLRYEDEFGVSYSELAFGPERLMVARFADGYRSPKHTRYRSGLVYLTVDNVDAHFARAKAQGATIISEPEDKPYGLRVYIADDPEGHRWMIVEHVRDVLPEEWGGQNVGKVVEHALALGDGASPVAT